jgi:hypothetical protein
LVRNWGTLRNILKTLIRAVPEAGNLFFLITIYIFVNALIGRQLFACEESTDTMPTRYNFNSFAESMVTVFIIVSAENWNEIAETTCAKFGRQYSVFFIQLVIVGNFMLLNLFLAILLKYIDLDN